MAEVTNETQDTESEVPPLADALQRYVHELGGMRDDLMEAAQQLPGPPGKAMHLLTKRFAGFLEELILGMAEVVAELEARQDAIDEAQGDDSEEDDDDGYMLDAEDVVNIYRTLQATAVAAAAQAPKTLGEDRVMWTALAQAANDALTMLVQKVDEDLPQMALGEPIEAEAASDDDATAGEQ